MSARLFSFLAGFVFCGAILSGLLYLSFFAFASGGTIFTDPFTYSSTLQAQNSSYIKRTGGTDVSANGSVVNFDSDTNNSYFYNLTQSGDFTLSFSVSGSGSAGFFQYSPDTTGICNRYVARLGGRTSVGSGNYRYNFYFGKKTSGDCNYDPGGINNIISSGTVTVSGTGAYVFEFGKENGHFYAKFGGQTLFSGTNDGSYSSGKPGIWGTDMTIDDFTIGTPIIAPENNSIDIPIYNTHFAEGDYTISGQCKHIGAHYKFYWNENAIDNSDTPDITCASDYTFSVSNVHINAYDQGNSIKTLFLYDFVDEVTVDTSWYVYPAGAGGTGSGGIPLLDWAIGFNYPSLDQNKKAEVLADDEFPLRFQYRMPTGLPADQAKFKLSDCTSIAFSSCTEEAYNSIDYFDENHTGFFQYPIDFSVEKTYYLKAEILDNTVSVFSTVAIITSTATETNKTQPPTLPDQRDLGVIGNALRDAFVPQVGFIDSGYSAISQQFQESQPQVYALTSAISGGLESLTTSGTMAPIVFEGLEFNGEELGTMTLLDTSSLPSGSMDTLKNIIAAVMYFTTGMWVIRNFSTIFSS